MKNSKRKISGSCGISSLELAVVLALIAIMATFTIPYLGSWLKHYRVVGASRGVASALQEARIKAVSDNREWRVVIDQDNDTISLEQGDKMVDSATWTQKGGVYNLPKGVAFVAGSSGGDVSGKIYVKFKPSGVAGHNTDGSTTYNEKDLLSIYVKGETADVYMIEIRSLTGRVAVSYWNGTDWEPT